MAPGATAAEGGDSDGGKKGQVAMIVAMKIVAMMMVMMLGPRGMYNASNVSIQ